MMNSLISTVILLISIISLVTAQGSVPTSVWATGTVAGGATTVTLSPFTQTFRSMYSTVASPKVGSIGLGTITGTVGTVKTKIYTTVQVAAST